MRVRVVVRLAQALRVAHGAELANDRDSAARLESRLESNLAARVVVLLGEADAGKAHLAKLLGHKSVSGELHKQIKRLLAKEYIEMTLLDKPNSRLQKYRLTDRGKALLSVQTVVPSADAEGLLR